MANLYIKVFTDFYANRKTAQLRAKIGDDAMWIPPRLWAYAAEHQSDGDFSSYSSEELAFLLGCNKHASSILEVLKECGFIDETGIIHDWEEHNGFHSTFSERAKTAAKARWAKKEKKQKKELLNTDTETETSIASSMLQASPWLLDHNINLPESLQTTQCIQSAREWLAYKKEIKTPYKPTGLRNAVAIWAKEFTAENFPAAVQRSIASGWKGIYGEKPGAAGSNTGSNNRGTGANGNPRNAGIAGFDEWHRDFQARAVGDGQHGPWDDFGRGPEVEGQSPETRRVTPPADRQAGAGR